MTNSDTDFLFFVLIGSFLLFSLWGISEKVLFKTKTFQRVYDFFERVTTLK